MSPATTERGRKTREKILVTAAGMFHMRGVNATSVDEVLNASGTGKSQFYHYFKSKDDLLRAVVRHHVSLWLDQSPHVRELDSFEKIQAWFDTTIQLFEDMKCQGGCPIGTMAAELSDANPLIRKELSKSLEGILSRIRSGLATMKKEKQLRRKADPDSLASFLFAAFQGGLLLSKTSRDIDLFKDSLRHAMSHLRSFSK